MSDHCRNISQINTAVMLQQSIILYQRGSLQRAIANSGSVCPSVRLSETLAIHA